MTARTTIKPNQINAPGRGRRRGGCGEDAKNGHATTAKTLHQRAGERRDGLYRRTNRRFVSSRTVLSLWLRVTVRHADVAS